MSLPQNRPPRIQIEDVWPEIDCGRYPVKRSLGDEVEVWATIFRDGHEVLGAAVLYRAPGSSDLAGGADALRGERPLRRLVPRHRARPLGVHGAGVGRPARVASATSSAARSSGGQTDLESELQEGAALMKVLELDVKTALASTRDRPPRGDAARSFARGRLRPRGRALRRLVRALPALVGRLRGGGEGPAGARRSSGSTSSTSRRSTRSAGRTARGRTTRSTRRAGRPGQSRGRSATRTGGHTAVDPELGSDDRLRPPRRGRAQARASRSRSTSRSRCSPDHPWLQRAPGVVPAPAGRDAQVRREPAEALPGHLQRSTGRPPTGRRSGRRSATSCSRWCDARRDASSASTTRTRSRSRSGSG